MEFLVAKLFVIRFLQVKNILLALFNVYNGSVNRMDFSMLELPRSMHQLANIDEESFVMKWLLFSAEIECKETVAAPMMTISDDNDLVETHFTCPHLP